jgi:hypothetical protein
MDMATQDDIRKTAIKLEEIYKASPESYSYLKGFIHCLLQKAGGSYPFDNSEASCHAEGWGSA